MESASLAMELQDCQKRCTVFVTPDTKKFIKVKNCKNLDKKNEKPALRAVHTIDFGIILL